MSNNNTAYSQYNCEICCYDTKKRSSYDKHLFSWKHINNVRNLSQQQNDNDNDKMKNYLCSACNKNFKTNSGFYKHKKRCIKLLNLLEKNTHNKPNVKKQTISKNVKETHCIVKKNNVKHQSEPSPSISDTNEIKNNDISTKELLVTMMQYFCENSKDSGHTVMLQQQLEEERKQCRNLMNMVQDMIPRIGNNNNSNNQININVFLKEQCKDALNLKDFVDSLRIELNDIINYHDKSNVDALGNVFVRGLNQLDLYKRPIHCMDLKQEKLYIKNNDEWEHNHSERDMLSGAITAVAAKQSRVIQEWEKIHPDWNKNEKLTNEYMRLVRATTQPIEKGSIEENKIIHNIAKEVVVDLRKVSEKTK